MREPDDTILEVKIQHVSWICVPGKLASCFATGVTAACPAKTEPICAGNG
jgi:hypothetical protein